uniref:Uncharacterized protein n=1 Tax=Setaria digitata TaxID=48799 RepID=A0A915PFN9_9BILA
MHDAEAALSLLKSLNWDIEKAIEEHLLDNIESLSTSSSGSDFVVIDRNSVSNKELTAGIVDTPAIISDADWNTAHAASLSDDTSESDESCEVISIGEGIDIRNCANVDGASGYYDPKFSFFLGSSPVTTDCKEQKE